MITREQVYGALFAIGQAVTWTGGGFAFSARQVKLFNDLPAQPALCQAEHGEVFAQTTRMPYRRKFKATWLIYQNVSGGVPTQSVNPMLDAVEAALAPAVTDPGFIDDRNTLGGIVHHCFIDGEIVRILGDLDGQSLTTVPISILLP